MLKGITASKAISMLRSEEQKIESRKLDRVALLSRQRSKKGRELMESKNSKRPSS